MNDYLGVLFGCVFALTYLWIILGVQASALNWQLSHSESEEKAVSPSQIYFVVRGPIVLYRLLKTRLPIQQL